MKTFTLIGYWEDTFETWWEFGDGETADQAVKAALAKLQETGQDVESLQIIGVIEGRHLDAVGYSFTGAYGLTEPLLKDVPE